MKFRSFLSATIASTVALSAMTAFAGPRYSQPAVVITKNADGSGYVEGTLGGVRNSFNRIERISCEVQRNEYFDANGVAIGGLTVTTCQARDSKSQTVSCFAFDESLADALNGVGDDGLIGFRFNSGGNCTSVTYYESSSLAAKK
ncbi:MAG TPA: hypothetical protein VFS24_09170 [Steroidobacteraceae bacterium]|nr:hypothetical protein [Steroidobacteraceae bacterium]